MSKAPEMIRVDSALQRIDNKILSRSQQHDPVLVEAAALLRRYRKALTLLASGADQDVVRDSILGAPGAADA